MNLNKVALAALLVLSAFACTKRTEHRTTAPTRSHNGSPAALPAALPAAPPPAAPAQAPVQHQTALTVETPKPASTEKAPGVLTTVYRTRTGTKYHREGCRYLSKSSIPISLKDAVASLGPCSVCRPPVLEAGQNPVVTPPVESGGTVRPPAPSAQSVQCMGITKKGAQCRRMTRDPSGYCYQHK